MRVNKALQRTSIFKKEEVTGYAENYIMESFIIFTLHIMTQIRMICTRNVHAQWK
jgi:hypothetical protein